MLIESIYCIFIVTIIGLFFLFIFVWIIFGSHVLVMVMVYFFVV